MSLKTRIFVITLVGLACILVFYSMLIYVFFVRISTDSEIKLLWNRAQTVLRKPEVRRPDRWGPGLLDEFVTGHSMLRIIDPAGTVRAEAVDDALLPTLRPVYRTAYHTRIVSQGKLRRIYIQVPILLLPSREQVGVLEMGISQDVIKGYLGILMITLLSGCVMAILFSVLIAYMYVRWIYKPVVQLAGTMERIETSGTFRRLEGKLTVERDEFGRLGATFNRMISRLEDNYERQRQFVEDASHELRTPLTVIRSYAGLLKRWGMDDPALRDEAVEAIAQESERLQQLVQTLLQSADRGEHLSGAVFQTFDMLELMQKTAKELSRSMNRKVSVIAEPGRGPALLDGSPDKLKQLLIILLDNALAYSDKSVTLTLGHGEHDLRVLVRDQGIGIAREHLEHLFDRFYRADETRMRNNGGRGLGLFIARKIVAEHHGSISVDSTPGVGTTVTVILPKRQESRSPEGTAD